MENQKKTYLTRSLKSLKEQYGIKAISEQVNEENVFIETHKIEETVIAKMMLVNSSIWEVSDILTPEMIQDDRLRLIYTAMLTLARQQKPFDEVSLPVYLMMHHKDEFLSENFGPYYLVNLTKGLASAKNIRYEAMIILQYYASRLFVSMIATAQNMIVTCDVADALEYINAKSFEIENIFNHDVNMQTTEELGLQAVKDYFKKYELMLSGITPGITSGFRNMDRSFGLIQEDDFVVIAARPSMGKTSFAISAIINMASKGIAVGFFSIESSRTQIINKIAANVLQIPYSDISEVRIDSEEKLNLFKASDWAKLPIYIDDSTDLTPTRLQAKVRRLIQNYGVKIIVIDYLQKMSADESAFSKNDEIGLITKGIKSINKRYRIPVIALAQLNRGNEMRGDQRPKLSDLRSSGEIEQDADRVIFIHRDAYYDEELKKTERVHETQMICAKNRNGATCDCEFLFDSMVTKFYESEQELNNNGGMPF